MRTRARRRGRGAGAAAGGLAATLARAVRRSPDAVVVISVPASFLEGGRPRRRAAPAPLPRIVFGNDAFRALAGGGRRAAAGGALDLFDPEALRRALRARGPTELALRRGDGREVAVEAGVARLSRGRFALALRDVTERRKREQAVAANREELERLVRERTAALEASHERLRSTDRLASIGTLAAGLGHDMGNILLPLICRLDLLEAANLPEAARENLRGIRQSVNYLRELSQGLRLFALDPDDPHASTGVTEIAPWWEQVRTLFAKALPQNIELRAEFEGRLPPVAVPTHSLTQAVLNLVANAGDAIPEGGVVRVWARALEDGRFVKLGVTDTGVGMSAEVRRHALEPFFTTKRRSLSTGLGLSIVHGVVKSVGGSVDIESRLGAGTTVTLLLPAADAAPRGAQPPASARLATLSLPDGRERAIVSVLLQSAGVRVEEAEAPGASGLWVVRYSEDAVDRARRFLAESPSRRVVLLASEPKPLDLPRAVVVDGAAGLAGLRDTLRSVVTEME
jgi:signal transduction histidine kinase